MREIQASDAKVHLPELLAEAGRRQEEIDKALAGILELRERTGGITVGELLAARDEGRKS